MKRKITKTVVIISSISVALGILLCVIGAKQNGGLQRYDSGPDREYLYPYGSDDIYDDFFDDFFDDFYDDFNIYGGGNDETSL